MIDRARIKNPFPFFVFYVIKKPLASETHIPTSVDLAFYDADSVSNTIFYSHVPNLGPARNSPILEPSSSLFAANRDRGVSPISFISLMEFSIALFARLM